MHPEEGFPVHPEDGFPVHPLGRPFRASVLLIALLAVGVAASAHPPSVSAHGQGRGRIGVRIQPMTPELREFFEAPGDRGVLVSQVEPGMPAEAAGVRAGDVVVAAGGEPVTRPRDLVRTIRRVPEGEALALELLRKGESVTLEVKPEGPQALPGVDPDEWMDLFERSVELGSRELRLRLEDLEQRLEMLERDLRDQRAPSDPAPDPEDEVVEEEEPDGEPT